VRGGAGVHALGVEALHLYRLRRQRHVALGHARRVRGGPTCLPDDPGRLRERSPESAVGAAWRVRTQPGLGRQASDLRADGGAGAALPRLLRPRAPSDRAGHPRTESRQRERLQALNEQPFGHADVRRRVRAPRAVEFGDLAAGPGVGDAAPALGGERVVLRDGVRGALARVGSGRAYDGGGGEPPGPPGRNSQGEDPVLRGCACQVHVAQSGCQVCGCDIFDRFAGMGLSMRMPIGCFLN
jgi:hypothetical protein